VTKSDDYGERRMTRFQTVVTAVVANRALVDGIEVRVQALGSGHLCVRLPLPEPARTRWRRE